MSSPLNAVTRLVGASFALIVANACSSHFAHPPTPGEHSAGTKQAHFYQPLAKDFKLKYSSDSNNASAQAWGDYWGWIKTFYNGNQSFFAPWPGWTEIGSETVAKIVKPEAKALFTRKWNSLGKIIGAEWAKDNNVRKISSDDLRVWKSQLDQEIRGEDGTGSRLLACTDSIQREADQKLKKNL